MKSRRGHVAHSPTLKGLTVSGQQQTKTKSLRAWYQELLACKQAELELEKYKDLILAAPADGISDKELVRVIKKALPAIKLTLKKLTQLRANWSMEASTGDASMELPPAKPKVVFPQRLGGA